jgi:hypothetical protein
VVLLLLGHLAWGLVRVPSRAIVRRQADITSYRRLGDAAFLFDDAALRGDDAITWLRAHSTAGQRIAWRGADRGAIEFAAALLWPRLLVVAPAGAAGDGPLLVATPTSLALELR